MIGLTDQSDYSICQFMVRLFILTVGEDCVALLSYLLKNKVVEFWVKGGIHFTYPGFTILTYFILLLFLCAMLSVSAREHICTYCKNRLQ